MAETKLDPNNLYGKKIEDAQTIPPNAGGILVIDANNELNKIDVSELKSEISSTLATKTEVQTAQTKADGADAKATTATTTANTAKSTADTAKTTADKALAKFMHEGNEITLSFEADGTVKWVSPTV